MFATDLRHELARRVHRRVHVAPQSLLGVRQRVGDRFERYVPDDEEIDVTARPQLATRRRAKHEGHVHAVGDECEGLSKHVGHTSSLQEDRLKIREEWRLPIRLEVDLPAANRAPEEPGAGQQVQLPLHGSQSGPRVAHDLAQVEGLVGMPQQPAEHAPSRPAEKDRRGVARALHGVSLRRTQSGYNRTRPGYNRQFQAAEETT